MEHSEVNKVTIKCSDLQNTRPKGYAYWSNNNKKVTYRQLITSLLFYLGKREIILGYTFKVDCQY